MSHSFPDLSTLLNGETLTIEYKRDETGSAQLSEDVIAQSLMALGNASGGYLLIGVDNSASVCGVHPHRQMTLPSVKHAVSRKFIAPPPIALNTYRNGARHVLAIYIEPAPRDPYQLTDGTVKIRKDRGNRQGPENLPFFLSELPQWHAGRGHHHDFSSMLLDDLPWSRYPQYLDAHAISVFQGRVSSGRINNPLLSRMAGLESQMDMLGLIGTVDGRKVLTNAALILFGSNDVVKDRLPSLQTQFQVFAADGALLHNLFTGRPGLEKFCLVYIAERLEELFRGIIPRRELMSGNFRIDVPAYGDDALREAAMNAFIHRDYTIVEPVVIQITSECFQITNPGSFYRDVRADNILFHEPCARNKVLAQACTDIGLMEKSGRGVDRIFWDQIRYLRPMPSYSESTEAAVRLTLLGGEGALENIQWMLNYFSENADLRVRVVHGGLMHTLITEGESTREEMIRALPGLDETLGRRAITELIDAGLMTRVGHGRGQRLFLSEKFQKDRGKPNAFKYQIGMTLTQQRKSIIEFIDEHGSINRRQAAALLNRPADDSIYRLLKQLVADGVLKRDGTRAGAKYTKA